MNGFLRNRSFAVGAGVCAVILLVEIVLLVLAGIRHAKIGAEWDAARSELIRLLNRAPYPSAENVEQAEDRVDNLEFRAGEWAGELNQDPFPQDAVESAEFSARTQNVIEHFRAKADAAGVVLPDSLEVGFARYASGGAVPGPEFVPRLTRQLFSAQRVASVLVESGVASITSMSRDGFEQVKKEEVRRQPRGVPRGGNNDSFKSASSVEKNGLYQVEKIGVTFLADEAAVWRVLQGITEAKHFMAVSGFAHRTETEILEYSPAAVKRGAETDDETLKYLAEGILTGEGALSRPERIITGNELIEVTLTVDVYNFNRGDDS